MFRWHPRHRGLPEWTFRTILATKAVGLPVFGYPITPAYDAPIRSGRILSQMVERNRLEYHAEFRPPYDVLLGRLGEDLLKHVAVNGGASRPGRPNQAAISHPRHAIQSAIRSQGLAF